MHVHLIGVAGTGMGALAGLLANLGHEVSGSDVAFHPPMGPLLQQWGVRCSTGFDAAHLVPRPDLVVVGNVARATNPEAMAAFEQGLEVTHIAAALHKFALTNRIPLVVTGTHGKTTTSSLCAWLLESAGRAPGFFIGGIAENFARGFRAAEPGAPFVVEGDEYDTAFFEKTAKFLHYGARHAILTSIEHDHVDIYPDPLSYQRAFEALLERLPNDGVLVANAEDDEITELVTAWQHAQQATERTPGTAHRVEWYSIQREVPTHSTPDSRWVAVPQMATGSDQAFRLFHDARCCGEFELPMMGRHNLSNALAALVACHVAFDVPFEPLRTGLKTFRGVRRRQQLLARVANIAVYDDFAHHPTAARETLHGLRQRHTAGKLFAVFEPRSATACRKLHEQRYAECFDAADEVLLAPIGRPELPLSERLDTQWIAERIRQRGTRAEAFQGLEPILTALVDRSRPGDAIVLLSNGAFGGIHSRLIQKLEAAHGCHKEVRS